MIGLYAVCGIVFSSFLCSTGSLRKGYTSMSVSSNLLRLVNNVHCYQDLNLRPKDSRRAYPMRKSSGNLVEHRPEKIRFDWGR